jgi:hypothetical protein
VSGCGALPELTARVCEGYARDVKRLELARIRSCRKCGRTAAELRSENGLTMIVPVDAHRAHELTDDRTRDALGSLTELVLAQLDAAKRPPTEIVLDLHDGRLRGLVAFADDEVIGCTAEEGIALAVRGKLPLYATDEAVAHATSRGSRTEHPGGDTVH